MAFRNDEIELAEQRQQQPQPFYDSRQSSDLSDELDVLPRPVRKSQRGNSGRLWASVGRLSRHSKKNSLPIESDADEDYDPHRPILAVEASGPNVKLARQRRRFRRTKVLQFARRLVGKLPIVILVIFGVMHILEALFGRTKLLWTAELRIQASSRSPRRLEAAGSMYNEGGSINEIDLTRGVVPIPCHSHNDYWRDLPLYDALHWGCTGVEADLWLFDGELYVGHTPSALSKDATLDSLYLNPLARLLEQSNSAVNSSVCNGRGVFATSPEQTLVLMLDLKTDGEDTLRVANEHLQKLRDMGCLTFWDGETLHTREITVVGSGKTSFDTISGQKAYRDIFFDAPLHSLWERPREPIKKSDPLREKDKDVDYGTAMALSNGGQDLEDRIDIPADAFNTSVSYYASTNFFSAVGYVWRGHLSPRQMEVLRGQIRGAKRRGLKVRYWGIPSWPTSLRNHIWHVLVKEGADILSVDDLAAAALADWTRPVHDTWFLFST